MALIHIKPKLAVISGEIGFTSILHSSTDIKLILLARTLRAFGYSGITLLLALYLKEVGLDANQIGVFMTLGFAGDLLKTAFVGAKLDHMGRKNAVILNSIWMALTGLAFYFSPSVNYLWIIVFFGCITPGGPEVGIFRAADYSSIAQLADNMQRSDYYNWYIFLGILSTSIGIYINSSLAYYLQTSVRWSALEAYKIMFLTMSICSVLMVIVESQLSLKIESDMYRRKKSLSLNLINEYEVDLLDVSSESDDLESSRAIKDYNNNTIEHNDHIKSQYTMFDLYKSPNFVTILQICILFFVDVVSKGSVLDSWVAYYVVGRFETNTETIGKIFSLCNILSSITTLLGTVVCKRVGPVITMIATHFPCSVAVFLIPFANNLTLMVIILLVRAMFKNMDMGSKALMMAAIADESERSALMAMQNSFRTLGQIVAPILTGVLTGLNLQWVSFLFSAVTRVGIYEAGIIYYFWKDRHSIGK